MADGEFKFTLSYAGHDEVLLNATNKSGKVEFGPLTYTTKSLAKLVKEDKASFDASSDKPTWTIRYIAAEQTDKLPAGVSATTAAIDAYVTVSTRRWYPDGDGCLRRRRQRVCEHLHCRACRGIACGQEESAGS